MKVGDNPRLKYLIDPSFMYPLNLTTYKKEKFGENV